MAVKKRGAKLDILERVSFMVSEIAAERHGLTTETIFARLQATRHEVTLRTVQRDLLAMDGLFGIYGATEAQTTRWHVKPQTNDSVFNDEAAFAVLFTRLQLKQTGQKTLLKRLSSIYDYAKSVLKHRNNDLTAWYRSVRFTSSELQLRAPLLNEELLQQLNRDILEKNIVKLDYVKHQGDVAREYTVTALGLLHRGKVPYLIARMYEENEPKHPMDRIRQFPVSRITGVRPTLFAKPQVCSFDFDEYLRSSTANYQIGKPFRLELEIFDSVRREIEDAHLGANQLIKPIPGQDKNWRLEVDVQYNQNLIHWLFGRSPYLKVIGPKPFRDMFYQDLKNALEHGEREQIEIAQEKTFKPFD